MKLRIKSKPLTRLGYRLGCLGAPESLPEDLAGRLKNRRLIFSVTNGRTGSEYLQRLLACVDGVTAEHEAPPGLEWLMQDIQGNRALARQFWVKYQLPRIAQSDTPVYADTGHLFCKGWIEPFHDLGLDCDLVLLTRHPRKIASSLLRLNTVPGRTRLGRFFYMTPNKGTLTRLADPGRFPDYALCWWHAVEMEVRQWHYGKAAEARGRRVVTTSAAALNQPGEAERVIEALGLSPDADDMVRIDGVRGERVNARRKAPKHTREVPSDDALAQMESDVAAAIRYPEGYTQRTA